MQSLNDKISPGTTQSSTRRWGLRAFKWPLKRPQVDYFISQIKRYKSLFALALQIDQVYVLNNYFLTYKLLTVTFA
jgi:hypothetical protein